MSLSDEKGALKGKKVGKGVKPFEIQLQECRDVIRESVMFKEVTGKIKEFNGIDRVRCLAIGDFQEDFPARYQLAFLLECLNWLREELASDLQVSIYDPVFSPENLKYLESLGPCWSIDSDPPADWKDHTNTTLFFLPHAPLDLTETVIVQEHPKLWLANNLIQHTDRYTKSQLFEKYPTLSKLVHILSENESAALIENKNKDNKNDDDEGFTTFTSKKKKRSRNKNVYREPVIDYDSIDSYFKTCRLLTTFDNGTQLKNSPWNHSFSDLAFHVIE
ncbi:hypothetical protein Kpol_1055p61 [Vanderwaltozyma polyspora DSM 70294]|uniref:SRR1-like domain-containing protein n=1 Tax=Vanderwaltozyma polyspora (strain ATCC 22028 / DSM 70294 / BCRC 21397 / CBS 2163 / NBRC 10782 / NRRL Y-8283 / UCD 57-17) TaxID=436907 RepID=A7TGD4_VANPO|nr:uncharacterized protein Kpol_1055p61 [Vanderwaltozyma polyspora DSM 70294]EDO18704.1 hypothetical protein Kpol_1055p61 [Vanderwaltozyma polyspora DSM 70294]